MASYDDSDSESLVDTPVQKSPQLPLPSYREAVINGMTGKKTEGKTNGAAATGIQAEDEADGAAARKPARAEKDAARTDAARTDALSEDYDLPETSSQSLATLRKVALLSLAESFIRSQHKLLKSQFTVYFLLNMWVQLWYTLLFWWTPIPPASWAVYAGDSMTSAVLDKIIGLFPPLLYPLNSEKGIIAWTDRLLTEAQTNWINRATQYVAYVCLRLVAIALYISKSVLALLKRIQMSIHGFLNDGRSLIYAGREDIIGILLRRWILFFCWGWCFEVYYYLIGQYLETLSPFADKLYSVTAKYVKKMERSTKIDVKVKGAASNGKTTHVQ